MILKEGLYESSLVEIITGNNHKNIIAGELYRIPGTNEHTFINDFESLLETIQTENKELIIGTDHNLDYLKINQCTNTSELFKMSLNNNIIPTINKPTRITHSTSTLIHNIYLSENLSNNYKSGIIISDIFDHLACFSMITTTNKINKLPMEVNTRKINQTKLNQ